MTARFQSLTLERDARIATVTIRRPEIHNAFNDEVVGELTDAFRELADDADVRVVILAGEGKTFSAGADLNWMRRMVDYTREENERDARALAGMYQAIDRCPKPVIARVQGAALGGGAGLVAVADIAVAARGTRFAFSEVRLGIIPSVISPFVLGRIGVTHAREYFLTGERFDADRAADMGLVAHVVEADALDDEVARVAAEILRCGSEAVSEAKALIFRVAGGEDDAAIEQDTCRRIAERRASAEGQEGMRAFLEKRPPSWVEE